MSAAPDESLVDDVESLAWLEQMARVVDGLAARRERGASDCDMVDALAATIAAATLYALAFEGASLDAVLERANAALPVRLFVVSPLTRSVPA